ncbi:MAG: hypothetical protein COA90_03950 [Gammaproteobacteria bacterium]|nr:MAG: hypothetical protein COA90_03950 [Gammaproteobacteria bacterium]
MSECKDIAEEASNYIEGNLPLSKRLGLFFHLVWCKCCRNYLQQIRSTISTISVIRPRENDNTDTDDLAKKLRALSQQDSSD